MFATRILSQDSRGGWKVRRGSAAYGPSPNALSTRRVKEIDLWIGVIPSSVAGTQPFHDNEPGHASVVVAAQRFAGHRIGLREERKLQAAFHQRSHVGRERPVPILDPYSRPFEPERKFIEVAVDRKMQPSPRCVRDPSLRGAGRGEPGEVCDQSEPPGFSTLAISP